MKNKTNIKEKIEYITISLPESLKRKIQDHNLKYRKLDLIHKIINISHVCRQALIKEINKVKKN